MKLAPIKVEDTIVVVFADASPTPLKKVKGEARAHGGFLVCLAHKDLMRHKFVATNMVVWRSGKIERECASSLSGETCTMVSGCAASEWVSNVYDELTNALHDPQKAINRVRRWNA